MEEDESWGELLPVARSRDAARANYNRLSKWYDLLAGKSERACSAIGAQKLAVAHGERVLEIGFGTGNNLVEIARCAGDAGYVYGIDISDGMLEQCQTRVAAAGLANRVELHRGDATQLPWADESLDAVFLSFTLELFDTPELARVIEQCHAVLKPDGRMCVVAMARQMPPGLMMRLYRWAHTRFPVLVDCRPIDAPKLILAAGFEIRELTRLSLWGLPVDVVLARRGRASGQS